MLQLFATGDYLEIFDAAHSEHEDRFIAIGDIARGVAVAHPFDGYTEEHWPAMIEWLCKHIVKLEHAFSEPLAR